MKNLSLTFCLAIATIASPSFSETIDDFVERNGKYYLKFSDEGFSGKVEGKVQGTLKDGVWEGLYLEYFDDGQLRYKETYKNGKLNGNSETYYENGQLFWKGVYKNGKYHGLWESYWQHGTIRNQGYFKDGERHGITLIFDRVTGDGSLTIRQIFKYGKEDGLREYFNKDGTLDKTETYKNGVKVE